MPLGGSEQAVDIGIATAMSPLMFDDADFQSIENVRATSKLESLEVALPEMGISLKMVSYWRPLHTRVESMWEVPYLYIQLAYGRLDSTDRVTILSRITDGTPGELRGSHICHHRWCTGLSCVIQEVVPDGGDRKACYSATDLDLDAKCDCGGTV